MSDDEQPVVDDIVDAQDKQALNLALNAYRDYLAKSNQGGVWSHEAMIGGTRKNLIVFAVQFDGGADLGKTLGALLADFSMQTKQEIPK